MCENVRPSGVNVMILKYFLTKKWRKIRDFESSCWKGRKNYSNTGLEEKRHIFVENRRKSPKIGITTLTPKGAICMEICVLFFAPFDTNCRNHFLILWLRTCNDLNWTKTAEGKRVQYVYKIDLPLTLRRQSNYV
jgi:hypothetical protein